MTMGDLKQTDELDQLQYSKELVDLEGSDLEDYCLEHLSFHDLEDLMVPEDLE